MFDLLPKNERVTLKSEYTIRRWTLFFIFLSFLGFIALVLLIPSYAVVYLEKEQLSDQRDSAERAAEEFLDPEVFDRLTEVSGRIEALTPHTEDVFVSEIVETILVQKPDTVSITSFAVRKEGERDLSVSLSGVAETRDILLNFSDSLEAEEYFTDIDIPLASLTREADVEFSFQITGELP